MDPTIFASAFTPLLNIASSDTMYQSMIRFAVVLAFAAVGELVAERAGTLNISAEAMLISGAFTGAVFTAQAYFQFASLNMETAVGSVVAVSMFRELGPVLAGVMVAGRVGAAMSAEIGTMKVTQQIDALRALAVSPVDYLVVPRSIAIFISMPFLVAESVGCGILASYYVGVKVLNISGVYFLANTQKWVDSSDIVMALVKGFFFAGIIVFISCREGLNAKGGAVGVGRATTYTVVNCSLAILIVNFFLTMALNIIFPAG